MRRIISSLSRSAFARSLVRGLRLHQLGNLWLRKFPLIKKLPGSNVIYRATRLESIPLAVEMFEKGNLYDATLLPQGFQSFADLGCNVGYFSCWLTHLAKGRPLRGVMLDANPQAVEEARWHAEANHWTDVHALNGILGEGRPGGHTEFYLYESNICSTSHLPDVEAMGLKGKWQRIEVPCLRLEDEWKQRFGDASCDVLKVDIEGSELNFLEAEPKFLKRVKAVLIEWHKWRVSLEQIQSLLRDAGFRYIKTLEENEQMGTAYFERDLNFEP